MSTWCWVISPIYDFCSFWSMAVNAIDKLQFLSFIFAVLLSVTVHFTALRLGRTTMHQYKIFRFYKMAAAAILDIHICEMLLADGVWMAQTHNCTKFGQNRSIGCEHIKICRFVDFSRWRPSPSWIFEIVKFYLLTVCRGPSCITVLNFVKKGRSVAEILLFLEFSRWPSPPSWIFEILKFYWLLWSRGSRRISVPNFVNQ